MIANANTGNEITLSAPFSVERLQAAIQTLPEVGNGNAFARKRCDDSDIPPFCDYMIDFVKSSNG